MSKEQVITIIKKAAERHGFTTCMYTMTRLIEIIEPGDTHYLNFTIAAQHNVEYLVLGAFGCGAFHNPPDIVVRAFNNIWPEFLHVFHAVEFAVYSKEENSLNYKAFKSIRGIKEDAYCS